MRLVQVDNGIVVNASIGADGQIIPDGWVQSDIAGIGWVADGDTFTAPDIAPTAPTVPATVSRFQARAALLQSGLLDDVTAIVGAGDAMTQLAWAEAVEFPRSSPLIATLAGQLGLSSSQVDDLFIAAAQISV